MLDVAIRLLGERGTHEMTLKDVGEQAGYSRGLASNRFGSKDGLFSRLVSYNNRIWKKELQSFVGEHTGLAAFLMALTAVEDFIRTEPAFVKAMYTLWYETISSGGELRERLAKQHYAYRADAERRLIEAKKQGEIRERIDTASFAIQYWSFISGTTYQWLVTPEAIDVKLVFRRYKELALEVLVDRPDEWSEFL